MPDVNKLRRYRAFLSYRHADNAQEGRRWAEWLHRSLERYVVPTDLVGSPNQLGELIPESLYPIFRDEDELPAEADLAAGIRRALEQSDCMIVLCSPRSALSPWVRQEVRQFKELGKSDRILAVILAGEPNADDPVKTRDGVYPEEECFPRELRFGVSAQDQLNAAGHPVIDWEKRTEPLAADLRPQGRRAEGFTSAAAYKEYLTLHTSLDAEKIESYTKAYGEQLERCRLKIIAGVLGIALSQLEDRDARHRAALAEKEAQRQKEIADRERTLADQARQTSKRLAQRNRLLVAAMFVVSILALVAILQTLFARQGRAFSQARKLYSQATSELNAGRHACSRVKLKLDQAKQAITNVEVVLTNDLRLRDDLAASAHKISDQLEQETNNAPGFIKKLGAIQDMVMASMTNCSRLTQQIADVKSNLQDAEAAMQNLDGATRQNSSNIVARFSEELQTDVKALELAAAYFADANSDLPRQMEQHHEAKLKLDSFLEIQPKTGTLIAESTNQIIRVSETLSNINLTMNICRQREDVGEYDLTRVQDSLEVAEYAINRMGERLLASKREEGISPLLLRANFRPLSFSWTEEREHPIFATSYESRALLNYEMPDLHIEYLPESLIRINLALTVASDFLADFKSFKNNVESSKSLIDEVAGELDAALNAARVSVKDAEKLCQNSQHLANEVGSFKDSSASELTKAAVFTKDAADLCAKAELSVNRINQAILLEKGFLPIFDGVGNESNSSSASRSR
ncbi:MAG: toll/interleukin-1 receptor domain-containing protein [Limisphaerales bacterium]